MGDAYGLCMRKFSAASVSDTPESMRDSNGHSVALCALEKYLRGEFVSDFEIAPVYLRPSQAERERLEKENKI